MLANANKSHKQEQMQTSISMLHKKLDCYKGGIQISSNAKELVLKEKGQTLSHLQTLHITASRSSQEEDRAGGGGVVSNRTGVDWKEKAGLKESQRKGSILISKHWA